jgi:putative transposase
VEKSEAIFLRLYYRIQEFYKFKAPKEIFKRKPQRKKELWGGEFWTDGYYLARVGERANWETVEKYIQRQGKPKEDLKQSIPERFII